MAGGLTCPKCNSENVYYDGSLWVCPDCAHEWNPDTDSGDAGGDGSEVRDANGNVLGDGDSVTKVLSRGFSRDTSCTTSSCRPKARACAQGRRNFGQTASDV